MRLFSSLSACSKLHQLLLLLVVILIVVVCRVVGVKQSRQKQDKDAATQSSSLSCPANIPSGACKAQQQQEQQQQQLLLQQKQPSTGECPAKMPAGACRAQQQQQQVNDQQQQQQQLQLQLECAVFMAPSTLGEHTNMGIYTGIALKEGDVVNYPELVVPLLWREWGKHPDRFGKDAKLWDRYIWEGLIMDIETYDDLNREHCRAAFVPGVGCTVNSVLDMHNVNSTRGSIFDTAGLRRDQDPGSGAFSPYHSSRTVVVRNVTPGTELLAKYGDYWISEIEGAQISMKQLLHEAEHFLKEDYIPFVLETQQQYKSDEFSDEMMEALWNFTTNFPVFSQAMTNLPRSNTWKEVEQAYYREAQEEREDRRDYGGDYDKRHAEHSVVQSFLREQQVRPLSWLYEHGYCQDHLKPGRSTIEQAGRGAFAVRNLPKGTIVGYAPLIHIGVHGHNILAVDYNNVAGVPGVRRWADLVINYSFGHPNSTVILTPYGGMVNYINHNSQAPNVKVQWPQKELVAHKPDWLQKDAVFLRDTIDKIGLSFEYVALRDIQEGEEIFMDYGPDWEEAWNAHLTNWKPLPDADRHRLAQEIDEPFLRTIHESSQYPYPPNTATLCLASYTGHHPYPRIEDNRPVYVWLDPRKLNKDLSKVKKRHYCVIVERHEPKNKNQNYTYTVDLKMNPPGDPNTRFVRVYNVTAPDGVSLHNLAFTHDWHMPNTFRHLIGIPYDIMPQSWLNGPPVYEQIPEPL